ncbi:MAG: hypothetical protein KBS89_00575 [Bacteroidales bacterium]|nr:hypothetical protein [Candidatus Egerieousia equi]
MKPRIFILVLLSCLAPLAMYALDNGKTGELAYVDTDKKVYMAGERLWISVLCLTRDQEWRIGGESSMAYVEMHSAGGMVLAERLALVKGRGAGSFTLPANLPTGNYVLTAYTKCGENAPEQFNKTISIYNSFTCDRVADGVEVSDERPAGPVSGNLVQCGAGKKFDAEFLNTGAGRFKVRIRNNSGKDGVVNISLVANDALAALAMENRSLADALKAVELSPVDENSQLESVKRELEYEGEIIEARVVGKDASKVCNGEYCACISVPGERSDAYCSYINEDGLVRFYTNNIYGTKDMALQIMEADSSWDCHLELISPFRNVKVAVPEKLVLYPSLENALLERSAGSQIVKQFHTSSLQELMPVRINPLLGERSITYRLDDYTRFHAMEELFVEFISELRTRKGQIQVRTEDSFEDPTFEHGASLVMLDGVPVFDHSKILAYDPLNVESVEIYPYRYFFGKYEFCGIANFVTYKRNMPGFQFNGNVRIEKFNGASYPVAYTCKNPDTPEKGYPDYRNTLYWNPCVTIQAGESFEFEGTIPEYCTKENIPLLLNINGL